jgi:hypothetical protein
MMRGIEDVIALLVLAGFGIWGFFSSRKTVRLVVASIFLLVVMFAAMNFEVAARSVISRHRPWTQEFENGVSEMLSNVLVFRPYILLAGAGLFFLAIKNQRTEKAATEQRPDVGERRGE